MRAKSATSLAAGCVHWLRSARRSSEQAPGAMSRSREQGIALIAVLWMLVLLSIVAAALSLETRSSTRVARNMAENAAARAAADAGVQRALLDLTGDEAKFRADGTV